MDVGTSGGVAGHPDDIGDQDHFGRHSHDRFLRSSPGKTYKTIPAQAKGWISTPNRRQIIITKGWEGVIPGDYIIPEWDLLVYVSAVEYNGDGNIFPGLDHPRYPAPYHVVEV